MHVCKRCQTTYVVLRRIFMFLVWHAEAIPHTSIVPVYVYIV
jgi:hypothetical protein